MSAFPTSQTDCAFSSIAYRDAVLNGSLDGKNYVLLLPRSTTLRYIPQKSKYFDTITSISILSSLSRPIVETYKAAHAFANSSSYDMYSVSREEYNEGGSNACRRKFRHFDWDPIKDKHQPSTRFSRREKSKIDSGDVAESDDEDSEGLRTKKNPKKPLGRKIGRR